LAASFASAFACRSAFRSARTIAACWLACARCLSRSARAAARAIIRMPVLKLWCLWCLMWSTPESGPIKGLQLCTHAGEKSRGHTIASAIRIAPDASFPNRREAGRRDRRIPGGAARRLTAHLRWSARRTESLQTCMGFGAGKAVLRPVACDQVPGARGRGQGTETLAQLGGLPP
jgi:hypothetical protein